MNQSAPLPSPSELKKKLPIKQAQKEFIARSRQEIIHILDGLDKRTLVIVGPCSIHDIGAAKEYARKLKKLADEVADTFFIVMRVYFEKPRTSIGWKGLLYDPLLDGSNNVALGLNMTRQLLLDLAEMGLPTATEFLDPSSPYFFGDLISWGCIGARTAASQTHRQVASGLPIPIAFKNSTDGNVDIAINGVLAAAMPHTFIGLSEEGQAAVINTTGNPYGHIVLRGGESKTNYDPESICHSLERLERASLPQRLIIDCSHDNSHRKHEQQCVVFQSVMHQIIEGNRNIRGVLLESNIHAGNQPLITDPGKLRYAVSLTDPCLDWTTTENLIKWGQAQLRKDSISQQKMCSADITAP